MFDHITSSQLGVGRRKTHFQTLMTRRDRELRELAEWADTYGVTAKHELLDALYAAALDFEDLNDLNAARQEAPQESV